MVNNIKCWGGNYLCQCRPSEALLRWRDCKVASGAIRRRRTSWTPLICIIWHEDHIDDLDGTATQNRSKLWVHVFAWGCHLRINFWRMSFQSFERTNFHETCDCTGRCDSSPRQMFWCERGTRPPRMELQETLASSRWMGWKWYMGFLFRVKGRPTLLSKIIPQNSFSWTWFQCFHFHGFCDVHQELRFTFVVICLAALIYHQG